MMHTLRRAVPSPGRRVAQIWLGAYLHPGAALATLKHEATPRIGLYAVLLRSALVVLLGYLPAALLGRTPVWPSYLTIVPDEHYYLALVVLFPLVQLALWLLCAALTHVILRLSGRASNIDHILNLQGVIALVVGSVLFLLDWLAAALGWTDRLLLGVVHLLVDLTWTLALAVIGYRVLLGLPFWLSVVLVLAWVLASVPVSALLLRPYAA
jgi:hypothetical protein